MSKDTATLAQALGTAAKFARVMQDAELPDDFYQRVIDNPVLRKNLVRFARYGYIVDLLEKMETHFSDIYEKLYEAGLRFPVGSESIDTISVLDGRFSCYRRQRHTIGLVDFHLRTELSNDNDAGDPSVKTTVEIDMGGYIGWSIVFQRNKTLLCVRDLFGDIFVPKKPLEEHERWFMGHCLFMDEALRMNAKREEEPLKVSLREAQRLMKVMVETFQMCSGFYERARVVGEVACPRCGGQTRGNLGLLPRQQMKEVYQCSGKCTSKKGNLPLTFILGDNRMPCEVYPQT